MNRWITMFSSAFTCLLVINVQFRFRDDKAIKFHCSKYLCMLLSIGWIIVNIWMPPVIAMCMNVLTMGLISCVCLYSNNAHKQQLRMLEQQEKREGEKYAEAMSILHDVNKHIHIIENLCQKEQQSTALRYTKQVDEMIRPLSPYHYVNNLVLDCLLQDAANQAEKYHIAFCVDVSAADINFMRPIDITTLFGNLLENAINACRKCNRDAYINFFMHELKLMCLDGAIKYIKDMKFGYADVRIVNEHAVFPYIITAVTHTGEEKVLIQSLDRHKIRGFISRSMADLTLQLYLKDTDRNVRYKYNYSVNSEDFAAAEAEDILEKYHGEILQGDLDTIINRELKFFVLGDEERWGFVVVPVLRKEEQLMLGPDHFFLFETDSWLTNFFDGTK